MRQNYIKLPILMTGIILILFSSIIHAQHKIARAIFFPETKTIEVLMAGDLIDKDKLLPSGKLQQLPNDILLVDAKNADSKKLTVSPSNIVQRGNIIQINSLDLSVGPPTSPSGTDLSRFNVCSQLVSVIVPFQSKGSINSVSAKVEAFEPIKNCLNPEDSKFRRLQQ